jgi:hypothetical protein
MKGTIAVVVAKVKFAKISLSPVQPVKWVPFGAVAATTVTIVPGEYSPLGLPFATLNKNVFGSLEPVAPSPSRNAEPAFNSAIVAAAMAVTTANSLLILFMLMGYYRLLRQRNRCKAPDSYGNPCRCQSPKWGSRQGNGERARMYSTGRAREFRSVCEHASPPPPGVGWIRDARQISGRPLRSGRFLTSPRRSR